MPRATPQQAKAATKYMQCWCSEEIVFVVTGVEVGFDSKEMQVGHYVLANQRQRTHDPDECYATLARRVRG